MASWGALHGSEPPSEACNHAPWRQLVEIAKDAVHRALVAHLRTSSFRMRMSGSRHQAPRLRLWDVPQGSFTQGTPVEVTLTVPATLRTASTVCTAVVSPRWVVCPASKGIAHVVLRLPDELNADPDRALTFVRGFLAAELIDGFLSMGGEPRHKVIGGITSVDIEAWVTAHHEDPDFHQLRARLPAGQRVNAGDGLSLSVISVKLAEDGNMPTPPTVVPGEPRGLVATGPADMNMENEAPSSSRPRARTQGRTTPHRPPRSAAVSPPSQPVPGRVAPAVEHVEASSPQIRAETGAAATVASPTRRSTPVCATADTTPTAATPPPRRQVQGAVAAPPPRQSNRDPSALAAGTRHIADGTTGGGARADGALRAVEPADAEPAGGAQIEGAHAAGRAHVDGAQLRARAAPSAAAHAEDIPPSHRPVQGVAAVAAIAATALSPPSPAATAGYAAMVSPLRQMEGRALFASPNVQSPSYGFPDEGTLGSAFRRAAGSTRHTPQSPRTMRSQTTRAQAVGTAACMLPAPPDLAMLQPAARSLAQLAALRAHNPSPPLPSTTPLMTMADVDELEDTRGDLRGARHVALTGSREEATRVLDSVGVPVSDIARLAGAQFAARVANDIILPAVAHFPRVSDRGPPDGTDHRCLICHEIGHPTEELVKFHEPAHMSTQGPPVLHVACATCVAGMGMTTAPADDTGTYSCPACRQPSSWAFPLGGAGGLSNVIRRLRATGIPQSPVEDFDIHDSGLEVPAPASPAADHMQGYQNLDQAIESSRTLLVPEDGEEVQGGGLSDETHATDINWSNPGSRHYSTPIVQVLIVIAGLAPAFFVNEWKPRFPRRLWGALQLLLIHDLPLAQDEHWTRALERWWSGPTGPTRQPGWEAVADTTAPMQQRRPAFQAAVRHVHDQYLDQAKQESILRLEYGQRPVVEYCALLQFQRWIQTRQWQAEEVAGGSGAQSRHAPPLN